jgi:hypothetical protein
MRRTSAERLVPAPWNRAGLKNAASPFCQRQLHEVLVEVGGELRLVEGDVAGAYFCECGRYIVGPVSTGMSQCATAPCRVMTGESRCTCAG